jgi:MFS family permease
MYLGSMLAVAAPPWVCMALGTTLVTVGVFVGSFMTSWPLFIFFYGIIFGIGVGMSYTAPLIVAWSYFPDNKGRVSGFVTSGFGFASAIFNLVSAKLVNPDNLSPNISEVEGNVTNFYFGEEVANRVPDMFRWLALIWLICGIIATCLIPQIKVKPASSNSIVSTRYPTTATECLSDKTFYILMLFSFLASTYGVYMLSAFKIFGSA